MKKIIIILLLIVLIVGAVCWLKVRHAEKGTEVFYRRVKISKGAITQEVTATGTVNPIKEVEVGAQVNGKIISLKVDYNSKVTEGQIVAQIDPATYEASYNASLAQLNSAKATLELQRLPGAAQLREGDS